MDDLHFVFVYGSLKKGLWNHVLLEEQHMVCESVTVDKYILFDGGFPVLGVDGMLETSDFAGQVTGELYLVDDECMGYLDSLEGHPTFYERKKIDIKVNEYAGLGNSVPAWTYFGKSALEGRTELITPDENGKLTWPKVAEEEAAA